MGEGKLSEEMFRGGKTEKNPVAPVEESVEEGVERDLMLVKACDFDSDGYLERVTDALDRLFKVAENNSQIRAELEIFSKRYEASLSGEELDEPEYDICKKIFEWFEKQRLGKFYYDKNNPRRRLGS